MCISCLQVRSYVSLLKLQTTWTKMWAWIQPAEDWCRHDNNQMVTSPSLDHLQRQWGELEIKISDRVWQTAIKWVHSTSIWIRHELLQLKVLRRLHLSANKLAKLSPGLDRIMCGRDLANLSHISWLRPKLISFWTGIFSTFSYVQHSYWS